MKTIVALERNQPQIYRYVVRANVPLARQPFYAARQTAAVSAYQDPDAPTQVSDQAALRAGQITERVGEISVAGRSLAQIQADLQQKQADFQAEITAANPWNSYGSSFDGTTWTMVTVT